jgi:hypothetical protein
MKRRKGRKEIAQENTNGREKKGKKIIKVQ